MHSLTMLAIALARPARFHVAWRGGPAARELARRHVLVRAVASVPASPSTSSTAGTIDVSGWLAERIQAALGEAFGSEFASADPMLTPATKPEFGDYQCNAALKLAKELGQKPRDVASKLMEAVELGDVCEPPEIAGPGFLNFRLQRGFVEAQLGVMISDGATCGVPKARTPVTTVVDYSSPNIAKEMHVGHLRSTIIGDTLARVLELRGHPVLRLNHVGDWGTQFGMLITHMRETVPGALGGVGGAPAEAPAALSDLVELYRAAKARFDAEPEFADEARRQVVKLQGGDEEALEAWRMLCKTSESAFTEVYSLLNVDPRLQTRGESFYNPQLPAVLSALEEAQLLRQSDGARCVFLDGYTNRDGQPLPVIVQKSDGGFMYSTTDLAAMRHRAVEEGAKRVLYVTDAGQALHFEQVFAIGKLSGLVPPDVSLEHVPFGLVQGEDGKKFKTRSGETVKLVDLLTEALSRARADVEARLAAEGRQEPEDFVREVAGAVGIGAVKYADLAMNRQSNYRFSYDKMLSLTGNTAPYMLYAYARIRGIQRRAAEKLSASPTATAAPAPHFTLGAPAELNLARHLLRLGPTMAEVERDLLPSKLCEYIFELAGKFNQFYEACPVLGAETEELRVSRLALCELTAVVLALNLRLLGIEPLERI